MPVVVWKTMKNKKCERVQEVVSLEARVVYPADFLPDQPPRILAHRCSKGLECNQMNSPTCMWAGTLPGYDPFV
jgi:hypothetical protein